MDIRAAIRNSASEHRIVVSTDGRESTVRIPGRSGGGSSLNGGEMLCAALATCYCNDIYREAARRGIAIQGVEVDVEAEFGGRGEPARRVVYTARVTSDAPAATIEALLRETDSVAEIQNTLRASVPVEFRIAGE